MMQMYPLVSIVIPFFNRKYYVSIMIKSIVEQKYKNWELLMVDDGSDDGTDKMIIEQVELDSRIKLYYRKDFSNIKGACACRNIGFKKAEGKYIIFFDSDDWITPDCIYNRVLYMEKHKSFDFSVFPFYKYTNKYSCDGYNISGVDIKENDCFNFIIRNLPFTVVSNIYKTQSLKENEVFWDEKLKSLQDADFNMCCISRGLKYAYASDAEIDYYVRMYGNLGSVSKCVTTNSHVVSHLYYLDKFLKLNKTFCKSNLAILMLAESLYLLIQRGPDSKENSIKLLDVLSKRKICYGILKIKHILNQLLFYTPIAQRHIYWLIFPELFLLYKKSNIKRGRKCKELYNRSIDIIFEIESIMMA